MWHAVTQMEGEMEATIAGTADAQEAASAHLEERLYIEQELNDLREQEAKEVMYHNRFMETAQKEIDAMAKNSGAFRIPHGASHRSARPCGEPGGWCTIANQTRLSRRTS